MNRVRAVEKCDDCGQIPQLNESWELICECSGKRWNPKSPVSGSAEDRVILEEHGWHLFESAYETYWLGPAADVMLYLYEDNTWHCADASERFVLLGDYLEWYRTYWEGTLR